MSADPLHPLDRRIAMKRRIILKALLIIGSVVCGVFLGRAVHSGMQGPKETRRESGVSSVEFPNVGKENKFTSPKPGFLMVKARASLPNQIVPESVYWFLLVRDPSTGAILHEALYDHQTFSIRAGSTTYPTFSEQIEFPPGFYAVTVGLKRVKPVRRRDGTPDFRRSRSTKCSSTFFERVK
jgi:hypothetical protein